MAKDLAHRFLVVRGRLCDAKKFSPPEVMDIRRAEADGEVFCPTCCGPMHLVIGADGPGAVHVGNNPYASHEPEDLIMRQDKKLLLEYLRTRFPSGRARLDVVVPEAKLIADVAFTNPKGGRMVIECQARDITAREVRRRNEAYERQGVRCLWILSSSRLKVDRSGGIIKKVTLEPLETALLALGEPLIYLDARTRQVAWVYPHPKVQELARMGEPRVGQVPALVRRYKLSELRVHEGSWWVDRSRDPHVTPPRKLPEAVQRKLDARLAGS